MRAWQIENEYGLNNLAPVDLPEPVPGPGQVVVEIKACALNYRDLLTVIGKGGKYPLPLVPCSDGAGVVKAVGADVTRVVEGQRVSPIFFQSWIDGPPTQEARSRALGGTLPGVLQDRVLVDAQGVVAIPEHLSFIEAATLPCAGLTAWRAIAIEAPVEHGQTVLVQGTGGVSIFALQFAKLRGATVIVTSSSDEKLARAKELGADFGINYRTTPDWAKSVRDFTGGKGVDLIVEVGGKDTLAQSLEAVRVGGTIVVIGVLSGFSQQVLLPMIYSKNLHLHGISVGSRAQFLEMNTTIGREHLQPVVDRTFPFAEVPQALRHMQDGAHFGKICIGL